jgi:hypothetical protein
MPTTSQLEDDVLSYQETITKLYSQSTALSGTPTGRWKPHTTKWLIHHDNARNYRITEIMNGIWKRTRDSVFFANLNVPKAVVLEVNNFIGTNHPWKRTGGNKKYEKSPGYKQWKRKKSTASVICAIIHMVPFDTRIPQGMQWAEDVVLRDSVAMANGFKPRRKYPSRFMITRQEIRSERPQTEAETGSSQQPSEGYTPLVEPSTQLDDDSDVTLDVVSHHGNEGVSCIGGHGRSTERPREPQAGSSSHRNIRDSFATQRTPETASSTQQMPSSNIQPNMETERRQYKETVRSILTPEEPTFYTDTEMPLASPETNDPNRLVAHLREEMKIQIAATVSQAKKETSEQHVRKAQALEKLMADRDKTLQGSISALEREVSEAKKTILQLQAAVSEKKSTAHDCAQVRKVHQSDAATQTLPERMGISEEEIKAIIEIAVASYEQEIQGQQAVVVD